MTESTTSQLNTQELSGTTQHLADWWRLDAAIEKVRAIVASMTGQRSDEDKEANNPASARKAAPPHGNSRDVVTADQGSHVNIVRIELGKETLSLILVLALVIGGCGVVMGLNLSRQRVLEDAFLKLDRQYRMTELKLDDWTVVAHRAGLALPGDYTRGPQGNLDAESFNIPQPKTKGK